MESFGDLVRRKRREKNLTQEALGAAVGRSQSYIQALESGDTASDAETRKRLCQALGLRPPHDISLPASAPQVADYAR